MPDNSQQIKKARKYALLLLKFRPRSINEFRDKLIRHGFAEDVTEELTVDFKNRGFLDDAKFARLWVQDRLNLKHIGKIKLEAELKAKGIDDLVIENALSGVMLGTDEYESAKELAEKRIGQLNSLDKATKQRRLFTFLQRHGFASDVSARVTRETVKK